MKTIKMTGVEKKYSGFNLGPLDLEIPAGAFVGYIGENGAGKTTTIKLMAQLANPDAGEIEILGQNIKTRPAREKARVGVVLDQLYLPDDMDMDEVEKTCKQLFLNWQADGFFDLCRRLDVPRNRKIKDMSKGMKSKLNIATAMSHQPELLIMDEPMEGLDPSARDQVIEILMEFMEEEGHTILLSSHIISDLERVVDYVAFIHQGQLLFMESRDELTAKYGMVSLSKEEFADLESQAGQAIVGSRKHDFGVEALVRRSDLPDCLAQKMELEVPSIETIMVFTLKGRKQ